MLARGEGAWLSVEPHMTTYAETGRLLLRQLDVGRQLKAAEEALVLVEAPKHRRSGEAADVDQRPAFGQRCRM